MPPVVLQVSLKDDASAGLRALQADIQKLGAAGTIAAPGLESLSTAEQHAATEAGKAAQAVKQAGTEAGQAAPKVDQLHQATEKSGSSFFSSAKSALGFAGALTGVNLGLSAIGAVVQGTIGQMVGFEAALANVATLGNNSALVQQRLREELLKLPPVLGDSTTLAKGLYDVLSAGIPASDAVAFLATSAQLAKAGLGDLGTTTEALTKTMAAFKIPIEDTSQLADVLFKTVDLGQGSLEKFAHAFPQVTQQAASMGLSFVDTAATMATLTQTFRNADTAATGFRSLLTQLIQNSDEFAAAGVNIQQVIGEEGMVGVFRTLEKLTGGNAEKMKVFVNDTEGLQAAIAGSGPQFKLLLENQSKFAESTGVVAKGAKLQAETVQETYKAFAAAAGQLANELAPPFLKAFADILNAGVTTFQKLRKAKDDFKDFLDQGDKAFADAGQGIVDFGVKIGVLNARFGSAAPAIAETASSLAELDTRFLGITGTAAQFGTGLATVGAAQTLLKDSLTQSTVKLTEQQKETNQLGVEIKGLNVIIKELALGDTPKLIDPDKLKRDVDVGVTYLQHLADSGKLNFTELDAVSDNFVGSLLARFGRIPAGVQPAIDQLRQTVKAGLDAMLEDTEPEVNALAEAFERFGIKTQGVLELTAKQGLASFKALLDSGEGTAEQLDKAFAGAIQDITEAQFKRLPEGFQAIAAQIAPTLKLLGEELRVTADSAGNLTLKLVPLGTNAEKLQEKLFGTKTHTKDLGVAFGQTGQEAEAFATNLRILDERAHSLEGSIQGLSVTAVQLGHSLNAAGQEVNAYGNEIARVSEETQKLNDLQIDAKTTFASDVPGLLKQLQQARLERAHIQSNPFTPTAEAQFLIGVLDKTMAAILDKLKSLGVDEFGQKLPAALSKGTTAASTLNTTLASTTTQVTAATQGAKGFAGALDMVAVSAGKVGGVLAPSFNPFHGTTSPVNSRPLGGGSGFGGVSPGAGSATTPALIPAAPGVFFVPPTSPDAVGSLIRFPLLPTGLGTTSPGTGWTTPLAPNASSPGIAAGGVNLVTGGTPVTRPGLGGGSGSHTVGGTLGGSPLLLPTLGDSVQRFARGGVVRGSGGTDSVPALLTPGERVSTPGQDRAISLTFGGDIHIHLPSVPPGAQPMDRIAAQAFVDKLLPAIKEALRRLP